MQDKTEGILTNPSTFSCWALLFCVLCAAADGGFGYGYGLGYGLGGAQKGTMLTWFMQVMKAGDTRTRIFQDQAQTVWTNDEGLGR